MRQRVKIAIALGSNLGDRLATLRKAAARLSEDLLDDQVGSSVYETNPEGITDQPKFYNAIVIGTTEWKPPAIVNFLKQLEAELGRTSTEKNGPRVIDLDLIALGDMLWDSEGVVVPHARMQEREFVLLPFADVWPDWKHPRLKVSVEQLLGSLGRTKGLNARKVGPLIG
jgi:2-amino-4-hydroxy-6-hydroxymethyldihydropteridine diphosphokinase